jgi:hypothetical protein
MKKLLLFLVLFVSAAVAQTELRLGVTADFPARLGMSHPSVGTTVSADFKPNRLWLSAGSHAFFEGKQDGGNGIHYGIEGAAHVGATKSLYFGGGIGWSELRVEKYTKNAYHPFGEMAYFFKFNRTDNRDSRFKLRYTLAGNDVRNHVTEILGAVRFPLPKGFDLENSFGVIPFHYTDVPSRKLTGIHYGVTLSKVF